MGILGSGCYPLAKMLSERGYTVSGSDSGAHAEYYTDSAGISIWRKRDTIPDGATLVIYSLAIDEGEAEVRDAKRRGITLLSRAQLLGALMSHSKTRISVSGSHGKSTTTAIIEHVLATAGMEYTAISGASLHSGMAYADCGSDVFLAEACEYKDSFLCLCPTHQIITSVELDHTDYFASLEAIAHSFYLAARRTRTVIINEDDPIAAKIAERLRREISEAKSYTPPGCNAKSDKIHTEEVITYGRSPTADYRIASVERTGEATAFCLGHQTAEYHLVTTLIGDFNLYNIAAAVALADSLGVERKSIETAVTDFHGIERRLSRLGRIGDTEVYYDYAHHPSEIMAVIRALKERYGSVSVIFRPHTYSRTASLWDGFIEALSEASRVALVDVYPAREREIEGVSSLRLAECIVGAEYFNEPGEAVKFALAGEFGAVALLGAGEVAAIKDTLLNYEKASKS